MGERDRSWLGWPLWLVSALLVVTALTGSAGPIQVIWVLGTISVAVSIAWVHLRGWCRGARRTEDDRDRAQRRAGTP